MVNPSLEFLSFSFFLPAFLVVVLEANFLILISYTSLLIFLYGLFEHIGAEENIQEVRPRC